MRFPSLSRSSGKIIAVADIGGGGSAVGFMRVGAKVPSQVLALSRAHMHLEERDAEHSITQLAASLKESAASAIADAAKLGIGAPKELYAVVHAPWVTSKTLSAQRQFDTETRVTDALIGELAKEALASDPTTVRDNLFEANVAHVELNGYPVHAPNRQSAHHVKVLVLASEMQREYRDALQGPLQASFPGLQIKWRSYVRAIASLLHQGGDDGRNAVVIDVADDGTSISVLRKQELTAFASVPAGLHTILAQLAAKGSREETLALISMLESGTCSSAECDRVGALIGQAETELTKRLGEGLGSLAAKRRLPNDLFILAHPDIAPWLSRFFSRIDFAQFTMTAKPFNAHPISQHDLARFVVAGTGVRADASACVAAALVHTEENPGA